MSRQNAKRTPAKKSLTRRAVKHVAGKVTTLGDLISAAYESGMDSEGVTLLLSPLSPLSKLLSRRIVLA